MLVDIRFQQLFSERTHSNLTPVPVQMPVPVRVPIPFANIEESQSTLPHHLPSPQPQVSEPVTPLSPYVDLVSVGSSSMLFVFASSLVLSSPDIL